MNEKSKILISLIRAVIVLLFFCFKFLFGTRKHSNWLAYSSKYQRVGGQMGRQNHNNYIIYISVKDGEQQTSNTVAIYQ
jgi:hypothetical protein